MPISIVTSEFYRLAVLNQDIRRGVSHTCIGVFETAASRKGRDAVAHVLYIVADNLALAVTNPSDCLILVFHIIRTLSFRRIEQVRRFHESLAVGV